ncbi:MAG: phage tail tube protein [Candidatus Bathyarchaeia archaeon]
MPETYGAHECRVYYVQESTYGQTPANPSMTGVNVESVEPSISPSLIQVRTVGSRDPIALYRGLRKPTLKIVGFLGVGSMALNFVNQAAVNLNSYSIQVLYFKGSWSSPSDVISLLFKGMRADKVTVEGSVDEAPKATFEFVGQDLEVGTSKITGATYNDPSAINPPYDVKIYRGVMDILRVTDWKFSVENNLKAVPVVRSTNWHLLKYLCARHRELNGELTFEFEDKTEFDDVINDTEFSLKFEFGGGYSSATFSNCKWEDVQTPTRVEDLVSLKARFTARSITIA